MVDLGSIPTLNGTSMFTMGPRHYGVFRKTSLLIQDINTTGYVFGDRFTLIIRGLTPIILTRFKI